MDAAGIADQLPIIGNLGEYQYRMSDLVRIENLNMIAIVWRRGASGDWQLPSSAGIEFVRTACSRSNVSLTSDVQFATDERQLDLVSKRMCEGLRTR